MHACDIAQKAFCPQGRQESAAGEQEGQKDNSKAWHERPMDN
jgi:hypothetical protein